MDAIIFGWVVIGNILSFLLILPICLKLKDNSLVDIGWAMSFVSMVWIAFLLNGFRNQSWSPVQILISCLVAIWGIRLIIYITVRKVIRGKGEDVRFVKYRESWKKFFALKTLLIIFVPQMVMTYIIGFSAVFANTVTDLSSVNSLDIILLSIGSFIWLLGFLFETVGDIQLLKFRNNPSNKGKTLNTGVWKYSRHPNYFGETTQWWGIFILALSLAIKYRADLATIIVGCVAILSPFTITFLLLKVSGIGLLEKTVLEERAGYKEYVATTSPFIPWFPKKIKNSAKTIKK